MHKTCEFCKTCKVCGGLPECLYYKVLSGVYTAACAQLLANPFPQPPCLLPVCIISWFALLSRRTCKVLFCALSQLVNKSGPCLRMEEGECFIRRAVGVWNSPETLHRFYLLNTKFYVGYWKTFQKTLNS